MIRRHSDAPSLAKTFLDPGRCGGHRHHLVLLRWPEGNGPAANFFRSLWIVGAALAASAVAVTLALRLHTLQMQESFLAYLRTYWGYAIWTFVQEFLSECFFLSRLRRSLPNAGLAALAAAAIFALGAPAQPHPHHRDAGLGFRRLPAVSPLPQPLSAGHGPRDPGHHRSHHHSRAGGS